MIPQASRADQAVSEARLFPSRIICAAKSPPRRTGSGRYLRRLPRTGARDNGLGYSGGVVRCLQKFKSAQALGGTGGMMDFLKP